MSVWKLAYGILALATATGCTGSVREVKRMPDGQSASVAIGEIAVTYAESITDEEMKANLSAALADMARKCATGNVNYRLDVHIDRFKNADFFDKLVMWESVRLTGSARLVDPKTSAVVASYEIEESRNGHGPMVLMPVMGLVMKSGAQTKLPKAFAEAICEKALRR